MQFKKKETAQDVVVACCIIHNMRKIYDQPIKEYPEYEYRHQIQVSENLQRLPQQHRLQNYLINHYFY